MLADHSGRNVAFLGDLESGIRTAMSTILSFSQKDMVYYIKTCANCRPNEPSL